MDSLLDHALEEVWAWKRAGFEATQGLTPQEIIRFYQHEAERVTKEWGLELERIPAGEAGRRRRREQA